jgi:hypothetical protein
MSEQIFPKYLNLFKQSGSSTMRNYNIMNIGNQLINMQEAMVKEWTLIRYALSAALVGASCFQ